MHSYGAVGRLEDKASIVRKSANQLLSVLLQFNPFGPSMVSAQFAATAAQYQAKLPPPAPVKEEDVFEAETEAAEADEVGPLLARTVCLRVCDGSITSPANVGPTSGHSVKFARFSGENAGFYSRVGASCGVCSGGQSLQFSALYFLLF